MKNKTLLGGRALVHLKACDLIVPTALPKNQYPEERSPQQLNLFPDEPAADISSRPCPSCNSSQVKEAAGSGCHHKSLVCANCDRWLKWIGKPRGGA